MHCIKTLGFLMVLAGYAMAIGLPLFKLYIPPEKTVPGKPPVRIAPVYRPPVRFAPMYRPPVDDLTDEFDDKPITVEKPVEVSSDRISVKPVDKTELPQQPGLAIKAAEEKSNLQNKNEKKDVGNLRIARAAVGPHILAPLGPYGSSSRRGGKIFGGPIRKEGKQEEDDDDEEFYK